MFTVYNLLQIKSTSLFMIKSLLFLCFIQWKLSKSASVRWAFKGLTRTPTCYQHVIFHPIFISTPCYFLFLVTAKLALLNEQGGAHSLSAIIKPVGADVPHHSFQFSSCLCPHHECVLRWTWMNIKIHWVTKMKNGKNKVLSAANKNK